MVIDSYSIAGARPQNSDDTLTGPNLPTSATAVADGNYGTLSNTIDIDKTASVGTGGDLLLTFWIEKIA